MSNLPYNDAQPDSSAEVKSFFNRYFTEQVSFPAAEIDAVVGFFLKRGFNELGAKSTAIVLLNQARVDGVNVFQLLDTIGNFEEVQLGQLVTQVLNSNREKVSLLGYKILSSEETTESRNVKP